MTEASPYVLWITGLSGAGKTTIGKRYYESHKKLDPCLVFLDGDLFREVMGNDLGHGEEDRIKNAFRISRMCRYLVSQHLSVICCTMSLYPEVWSWNRENIPGYKEVYLKVEKETVISRDPKGHYKRALSNGEGNVIGLDLSFHEPTDPDLTIENDGNDEESIIQAVSTLESFVKESRAPIGDTL